MTWPLALRLGRVSNLPTVWTNVLAGIVLAAAPVSPAIAVALMLAISLFYVAGMYFNDAFDARFDRTLRPSRPIPSGAVSAATVIGCGAALLGAGLIALLVLGSPAFLGSGARGFELGLGLGALILLYDAWHKGNPAGPVVMGLCRAMVYLTVAATVAGSLSRDLVLPCVVAVSYLVGLTYAAKQEDLMVPGHLWPLAFLAVPVAYGVRVALHGPADAALFAAFVAAVGYALSLLLRGRAFVSRAVAIMIAGISLLDGLFIGAHGRSGLATATLAAFAATLVLQRYVAGT